MLVPVVFSDDVYHFLKTSFMKNKKEVVLTQCGKTLDYNVVENDPKVTIPHCLKCINYLAVDS